MVLGCDHRGGSAAQKRYGLCVTPEYATITAQLQRSPNHMLVLWRIEE
jgi:hypothetical protein